MHHEIILQRRGDFGEVLMLTPVIEELKLRNPNLSIKIETDFPEIFRYNSCVDLASEFIEGSSVLSLNKVTAGPDHLMDAYAQKVFGDDRLLDRGLRLYPEVEKRPKKGATGCFSKQYGIDCDKVSGDIGEQRQQIADSEVYIGDYNPTTFIAMTTDTPIIALFGFRNEKWIHPFRKGIPFICLSGFCSHHVFCQSHNCKYESGTFQYVKCPTEFECEEVTAEMIKTKIEEICG